MSVSEMSDWERWIVNCSPELSFYNLRRRDVDMPRSRHSVRAGPLLSRVVAQNEGRLLRPGTMNAGLTDSDVRVSPFLFSDPVPDESYKFENESVQSSDRRRRAEFEVEIAAVDKSVPIRDREIFAGE